METKMAPSGSNRNEETRDRFSQLGDLVLEKIKTATSSGDLDQDKHEGQFEAPGGSNRNEETRDKFSQLGDLVLEKIKTATSSGDLDQDKHEGQFEGQPYNIQGELGILAHYREIDGCLEEKLTELEEKGARKWKRLGDLGFSAGLREAGYSEESIVELDSRDHCEEIHLAKVCDEILDRLRMPEDGRAVFYALVGRGISSGKSLHIRTRISWRSENEAAALCSNLSSNTNVEKVYIYLNNSFATVKEYALLGRALCKNSAIRTLHLTWDLNESQMRNGHDNVRALFLLISYLEGPIHRRTTFEELSLELVGSPNTHGIGSEITNRLFKSLSQSGEDGGMPNISLKKFHLSLTNVIISSIRGIEEVEVRKQRLTNEIPFWPFSILSNNKILYTLDLRESSIYGWESLCDALKKNETLRELHLRRCKLYKDQYKEGAAQEEGAPQDAVDNLMDLLRSSNSGLTLIYLCETIIDSWQGQIDEQLRRNREYGAKLRGEKTVKTTSGRLVLCGYGFAGKTAICKTMERIEQGTPWSHWFTMGWKELLQTVPGLRQMLYGKDVTNRTRGFDVLALKNQQYLKFIWDFAGQKEYYALHDYLFPEIKNSCFLYVSSCRLPPSTQDPKGAIKSEEKLHDECEFWMKFIASNSELRQTSQNHTQILPQVRFVLTNKDTLNSAELEASTWRAKKIVRKLKRVFKDVIDLCEVVEVVNAHSSTDVERLLTLTNDSLRKILAEQTEYAICEEVRDVLAALPASNPFMSISEFYRMQKGKFHFASAPTPIKEAVLKYLNNSGEIIFPKVELDLVVANPRWFGVHVLGSLINAFKGEEALRQPIVSDCVDVFRHGRRNWEPLRSWGLAHDHGYVEREDMEELLRQSIETVHLQNSITSNELLELMIDLELCFKKQPESVDSSLFLPALFDDDTELAAKGERKLDWNLLQPGKLIHIGRRLECQNKATTFLTPGFFPRLQVHLRNYCHEKGWTKTRFFAVDRNLIRFVENGMEVLVEYSGDIDYFVDILVRSAKSHAETLKFIDEHVVQKIQHFCATAHGCQGVILVEAVIRPVCVKDLHLCTHRKIHSVPVLTLRSQLEADKGYAHTWEARIERAKDVDYALDLLEGEGSYTRFLAANQVDVIPEASNSRTSMVDSKLPRLFYPTIEDVGMLPKLDALLSGDRKIPMKIHLMCEDRDGFHRVEGQQGRTFKLNWKAGGYNLPILKYAISLLGDGISAGISASSKMAGRPVRGPLVNTGWIENMFEVPEMPIPAEVLVEILNCRKPVGQVSDDDILMVLKEYWKIDKSTEWLKRFLNVQDSGKFLIDFGLHKVKYTDGIHSNMIAWVCEEHYGLGLQRRILESVHH